MDVIHVSGDVVWWLRRLLHGQNPFSLSLCISSLLTRLCGLPENTRIARTTECASVWLGGRSCCRPSPNWFTYAHTDRQTDRQPSTTQTSTMYTHLCIVLHMYVTKDVEVARLVPPSDRFNYNTCGIVCHGGHCTICNGNAHLKWITWGRLMWIHILTYVRVDMGRRGNNWNLRGTDRTRVQQGDYSQIKFFDLRWFVKLG